MHLKYKIMINVHKEIKEKIPHQSLAVIFSGMKDVNTLNMVINLIIKKKVHLNNSLGGLVFRFLGLRKEK